MLRKSELIVNVEPGHLLMSHCRRLFIRRHEVMANIGIHDFEKANPQRLWIDVDLFVSLSQSTPQSDELIEVVDYDFVRQTIANRLSLGHIGLQETLCDELASEFLKHSGVFAVRLSTCKPDVYADCEAVGVEVFVSRKTL